MNPGEIEWRDAQIAVARALAERYGQLAPDELVPVEALEAVVAGWLDGDDTRLDINTIINSVGITFGCHLAQATGLTWVIATDEFGTDLALHGQPGHILLYPANAVGKRILEGEHSFLAHLLEAMADAIEQRKALG